MTSYTAPARRELSGDRHFTWFTPIGSRATEYEEMTVDEQSTPAHYAFQGWPIRFDDGRDPYFEGTTALRSSDWYLYRDPNQTIQRTYVSGVNESEKALERSITGARDAGLFSFAHPDWVATGLATHYMTFPYVEYGLFLALCYAEREALSDTTTFSIVFEAADKLRHLQDVVYYSFELAAAFPTFDDSNIAKVWKQDPVWQGARAAVENIIALDDWMEVVVATNLCFDRIFGELAKVEYFSRFAAANGDVVTPIIIASSEADSARTLRWTVALMEHLLNDPLEAKHNRRLVGEWLDKWTGQSQAAVEAFRPVFDQAPSKPSTFDEAMQRVDAKRTAVLEPLGLLATAKA